MGDPHPVFRPLVLTEHAIANMVDYAGPTPEQIARWAAEREEHLERERIARMGINQHVKEGTPVCLVPCDHAWCAAVRDPHYAGPNLFLC